MNASKNLCHNCFADKGTAAVCPHCGYQQVDHHSPIILSPGTLLHNQYLIGRVLGEPGGFGITYLAWDTYLQARMAVKEYLPRDLAGRNRDQTSVLPHTSRDAETFRYGLEQFLQEARTLAKFDHPNVVRVRTFFEAHGTAYLVMDYYEGTTLDSYLKDQPGSVVSEEEALHLLGPVLDGLREVHQGGFLHRDIKPANIYLALLKGGGVRPVLLDFGAARMAAAERSQSMSAVLTPGYAPYEQYHRRGNQGPWTDVYACSATLYRMVTGQRPADASERMYKDELEEASVLQPSLSAGVSRALWRGLSLRSEDRPQTVEAFQRLLQERSSPPPSPKPSPPPPLQDTNPAPLPAPPKPKPSPSRNPWLSFGPWVIVLGLAVWISWLLIAESQDGTESYTTRTETVEPEVSKPEVSEREIAELGMTFAYIAPGSFRMGSTDGGDDEKPVHEVVITEGFYMLTTEVTQGMWQEVMGTTVQQQRDKADPSWPLRGVGSDRPMYYVSWEEAQAFLRQMNGRGDGWHYRLPTEAEWEYAARAGTTTAYFWGNAVGSNRANCDGCGSRWDDQEASPVGSFAPNAWGLYDMHGNVWEWVEDWYGSDYYGSSPSRDPRGPSTGTSRVLRGGSWGSVPSNVRSASRSYDRPSLRNGFIGVRFLRTR